MYVDENAKMKCLFVFIPFTSPGVRSYTGLWLVGVPRKCQNIENKYVIWKYVINCNVMNQKWFYVVIHLFLNIYGQWFSIRNMHENYARMFNNFF